MGQVKETEGGKRKGMKQRKKGRQNAGDKGMEVRIRMREDGIGWRGKEAGMGKKEGRKGSELKNE